MALQCKTRASGGSENAGFKTVLLAGEHDEHNRQSSSLQPIATPIRRVVTRLERQFSLSRAHARVVAELAFPGVWHE